MDMSGAVEGLIRKAAHSIPQKPGDYIEDGLLHCGKCRTPKQCRVELFGEIRTPMCLCQCEKEKRDLEDADFRRREKLQEIERLRSTGFPDREMKQWRFENDDGSNEKISSVCKNYVEHFPDMRKKGKGLLMFGPVGTGKTFAAACIANALIDQGYPCMVTNFARLTNTLSGMREGKQDYIDNLDKFALLVIDDLASERDTEFMGELIFNIIDSRYRSGKPLIITTNLTADELKHPADMKKQRIYSRLFEMCFAVEVKGRDRRKQKMIADHDELEDLLGL